MMFSKGYCPFCAQAKALLNQKRIAFTVIEMDEIPRGKEIHMALKKFSKQNTVPNIYIGGNHIGGYSELLEAVKNGKLKQALDAAGVSYTDLKEPKNLNPFA